MSIWNEGGNNSPIRDLDSLIVTMLRLFAAFVTLASIQTFAVWIVGRRLFPDDPGQVSIFSTPIALFCAGFIWLKMPIPRKYLDKIKQTFGQRLLSRIAYTSTVLGGIGLVIGYFGPLVLAPNKNLGPLLGILFTGPLGVMLGPPIGVATLLKTTTLESLSEAWRGLVAGWILACCYYCLSDATIVVAIVAVGVMIVSLLVVALVIYTAKSLQSPSSAIRTGYILLAGGLVMLLLSLCPPVIKSSLGDPSTNARVQLPQYVSLLDRGFDSSYHSPLYTIHFSRWLGEMLAVLALMGVAYAVFSIFDQRKSESS